MKKGIYGDICGKGKKTSSQNLIKLFFFQLRNPAKLTKCSAKTADTVNITFTYR